MPCPKKTCRNGLCSPWSLWGLGHGVFFGRVSPGLRSSHSTEEAALGDNGGQVAAQVRWWDLGETEPNRCPGFPGGCFWTSATV